MVCRGGAANSVAMELDSGGHSQGCSPGEIAVFWETLEGQWAGGAKLGTLCAQAGAASPQAASAQKGPTSIDKRSTSTPPHPTGHLHSLQPGPFTLLLGGSLSVMTADVEQVCLR